MRQLSLEMKSLWTGTLRFGMWFQRVSGGSAASGGFGVYGFGTQCFAPDSVSIPSLLLLRLSGESLLFPSVWLICLLFLLPLHKLRDAGQITLQLGLFPSRVEPFEMLYFLLPCSCCNNWFHRLSKLNLYFESVLLHFLLPPVVVHVKRAILEFSPNKIIIHIRSYFLPGLS